MSRNITPKVFRGAFRSKTENQGFSLVELLVVLAIVAIISTLVVFALPSISGSRDLAKSAYRLAGALEQARTYAMANNTYSWVGFFEEDGSQPSTNPATTGIGRLVVSIVASQDGTSYSDNTISSSAPEAFGIDSSSTSTNKVILSQISPLMKLDGIHMAAVNNGTSTGNNPARPAVLTAYQVGDSPGQTPNNQGGPFAIHVGCTGTNPTTFTYPLSAAGVTQTPQYTFAKIIEFNPQGEASKIVENVFSGPGPQNEIEVALQHAHGNVVDPLYSGANQTMAAAAIQVEGLSGQVRVYRP